MRRVRGPDLTTGQWSRGGTDAQLFRTIMQGIPGTDMPGAQNADATPDQGLGRYRISANIECICIGRRRAATPRTARRCSSRSGVQ